jgi:polar amino acid transport system substrate-binding protein
MNKRKLSALILAAILAALIAISPTSARADQASDAVTTAVASLSGKTAGVMTGTPQDEIVKANVADAEILYFNSSTDLMLALQSGKIDFFVLSSVNYYSLAEQYSDLGYIDADFQTYDVGAIFPMTDNGTSLKAQYDEYVTAITKSGELKQLQDYWLMPNAWENVDIPTTGDNGVLHMATANTQQPFSMELNGKNAGFDIAVAAGFCKAYGYGLQIDNVDFAGMLTGITTGMYDFAAGQISWTEERAKSVLFSDSYYTQKIVPIVRASDFDASQIVVANSAHGDDDSSSSSAASGEKSLLTSIRRTLVDQDRWVSVLCGLGTTLIITFAGFALANLLGALFCAMTLSHSRALKVISRVYSGLMQGLPVVVILMILYYIVFAKSKFSNVAVASIGFGLVFGAYMAQLFEGAINGVDAGQREAAIASGLTERQAFLGIVLPQAARTMLPGYFSNLISLMKGTAIVGYIAVADLTKAGDVIRSATYEAFVPLITVAVIYLLMASLMLLAMQLVKHLLTRPRTRKAGVRA